MVMYIVLRARLDRQGHPRLYQEYHPDRVIAAVQEYTRVHSGADPNDLGRRALAALQTNYDVLLQAAAIRQFRHSLSPSLRKELLDRLKNERHEDSNAAALLFNPNGTFQGHRSLRYVTIFTTFHKEHPDLTDEALYEVASILGNDLGLNARYFFDFYRHGLPEEGRVVENPTFDFAQTGDNLPTVK